jgi:3-oxoacyl-[acyl-carrier-protein] synthase II
MKVVIDQSDAVTAYGWGMNALWAGLLSNRTAIQPTNRFAERGFVSNQAALIPGLEVDPEESRAMAMLKRLLHPLIGKVDPLTTLVLATTVGEIEYVERSILEGRPELARESRPQVLLGRVKSLLQLRGRAIVISSACASSAVAVTQAASMIRCGDEKSVLVVSCDAVSEFVYSGFSTLLSLSAEPARPFDAERSGLTLGEAAAWVLLRSGEMPTSNGAASILGWGNSTDAIHMTAPDRSARGLSRAIAKACKMGDRTSGEILFVAAHGTATLYSDSMELLAFKNSFGQPKPVFSIKGGVGHTLASAALLQILVSARAMAEGILPGTVGLMEPDPNSAGWVRSISSKLDSASVALSTNSGFGGVNTAILVGNGALE